MSPYQGYMWCFHHPVFGDLAGIIGRPHQGLKEARTLLYVTPVRVHSFSLSLVTPAVVFLLATFLRLTRFRGVGSRSHATLSSRSASSSNRRLKCRSALLSQRALVVTRRRLPGIVLNTIVLFRSTIT